MKYICVYCGSSPGSQPAYLDAAVELGQVLAERDLTLVYGGGSVGLMGVLADAALQAGGKVTGVIPRSMVEKGVGHSGLTDLKIVETMHERKALMAEIADGFVAMPGGFGTIEEIFEVITWAQLGYHIKPCGFLNTAGFFDHLVKFLDHAVAQSFIGSAHRGMLLIDQTPQALLAKLSSYQPPHADKFISALHETEKMRIKKQNSS